MSKPKNFRAHANVKKTHFSHFGCISVENWLYFLKDFLEKMTGIEKIENFQKFERC